MDCVFYIFLNMSLLLKNQPTCLDWLDIADCNESILISGDIKGNVFKWNMSTNTHVRYFPENKPITQLKACYNKYLVSIGYKHGTIVILNVQSEHLKIVYKLKSHEDAINYLYWNPKENEENEFSKVSDASLVLCSSSDDKTIRFWSIEDGTQLKMLPAPVSGKSGQQQQQQQKSTKINLTPLCWPTSRYIISASYRFVSLILQ